LPPILPSVFREYADARSITALRSFFFSFLSLSPDTPSYSSPRLAGLPQLFRYQVLRLLFSVFFRATPLRYGVGSSRVFLRPSSEDAHSVASEICSFQLCCFASSDFPSDAFA